jgi:hypothetical protein
MTTFTNPGTGVWIDNTLVVGSIDIGSTGKQTVAYRPFNKFSTNFSVDQKEDNEDTEFETQQYLQMIPYETKMDTIDHSKTMLYTVDSFYIPADCPEMFYVGSWGNSDAAGYMYGRARQSQVSGDYAIVSFSGVSLFMASAQTPARGFFTVELSRDNGATWEQKKQISNQQTAAGPYYVGYMLYEGLPFADYKVKITVGPYANNVTGAVDISHFVYTTYCVQKPIYPSYKQATAIKTINDVSPCTTLVTGLPHAYLNTTPAAN